MNVELFYIENCPNYPAAADMLKEALRERGLPENISEIAVSDSAQAEALAFRGSPTIRVDGNDIEDTPPMQDQYGLSCRTYLIGGKLQGLPPRDMIRRALRTALRSASWS